MSSQQQQNIQRSRWTFTLNNYDGNVDYKNYMCKPEFKVSRAVWGREIGVNGIPHLQGYLELERSLRLSHVRKIFPTGHWEGATENSLRNYRYCTKDGDFEVIGNFSAESRGMVQSKCKALTSSLVIQGLLFNQTSIQVKLSKEYSEKHSYFDKITSEIKQLEQQHKLFNRFKNVKLYPWQYQVIKSGMEQTDRKVLWVVDFQGNAGKTFLGQYLCAMYGFKLLDGTVSTRDLAYLLKGHEKGFCFDVSRASMQSFCYASLEAIKNGYVISGKYGGKQCIFEPMHTVIFSNEFPDLSKLSRDRWTILTTGEGILSDMSKNALIDPSQKFPFVVLPSIPDFTEDFDYHQYLRDAFDQNNSSNQSQHQRSPSRGRFHTSQPAGRSNNSTIQNAEPAVVNIEDSQDIETETPVIESTPMQEFSKKCPLHGGKLVGLYVIFMKFSFVVLDLKKSSDNYL